MSETTVMYAVGIDVGTTSLSAQVIDLVRGKSVESFSQEHGAAIAITGYPDAFADDAKALCRKVEKLLKQITKKYSPVVSLGVTGQMHGIVCLDEGGKPLSPLYTWQNGFGNRIGRLGKSFCAEIAALAGEEIPTGYGVVTYYALREMGILPANTAFIATIPDLVVANLTGTLPVSHPSNMASLGMYDLTKNSIKSRFLELLRIPESLFPPMAIDYLLSGEFREDRLKIPVAAAIGDNQASVLACLASEDHVLVNVGTGSQVTLMTDTPSGGEVRPFFDGKSLVTGCALCGGRAYAALCDFVSTLLADFGCEKDRGEIYAILNQAAEKGRLTDLSVVTSFSGSRENPNLRGSVTNLSLDNFHISDLSAGVLKGIVAELHTMFQSIKQEGREYIPVVSGNAMRNNPILRDFCGKLFGKKPLIPAIKEEAAYGAALYGAVSAGFVKRTELCRYIQYEKED